MATLAKHESHIINCTTCAKCFVITSHIQIHMKTHTSEKTYNCRECDMNVLLMYYINNHETYMLF